ncbi:TOX high mobility group box family member 2-like isoform X1 [Limulus polyphemus]|uniref:TOX high mobility group box family member 2-like isoform X1 n=1 Tax=Limulus polyphemus TaxID=6850 RepID=A0ABM1T0Q2_LIMPO|nr:TOX high mobility group box family member 2-like isoform X1 [Limulus polyphemus]
MNTFPEFHQYFLDNCLTFLEYNLQTFHTPSFGDEEFDIPPFHLSSALNGDVYGSQPLSHLQPQGQGLALEPSVMMTSRAVTSSPSIGIMGNHQYTVVQDMYPPPIGGVVTSRGVTEVHNMHIPMHSYNGHLGYGNPQVQQQHHSPSQSMPPPQMPPSGQHQYQQTISGHMRTLNQSQLSSQLGMHVPMNHPIGQAPASVGSSPRSNQTSPGHETSEDSDDSNALAQLMVGVKRPSPEPVEPTTTQTPNKPKKPKVQKKKKRDPNEPQKPVSAYALFFRDTQAAIKGQNPNASFGEVSKIVASMWDGLEADHKNVYKKKTEAAKKDYLKALAAYRASLVSKAASDQSDNMGGNSVTSTTHVSSATLSNAPSNTQSLSKLQKKSPLLTSLIEGSSASVAMTQPQPPVFPSQVWTMTPPMNGNRGMHQQQMQLVQGPPQMLHQQIGGPMQQQQMLPMGNLSAMSQMPPPSQPVSSAPSSYSQSISSVLIPNNPGMTMSQNMLHGQQQMRNGGCTNPPVNNPDWEKEYHANDFVVSNCSYQAVWNSEGTQYPVQQGMYLQHGWHQDIPSPVTLK